MSNATTGLIIFIGVFGLMFGTGLFFEGFDRLLRQDYDLGIFMMIAGLFMLGYDIFVSKSVLKAKTA